MTDLRTTQAAILALESGESDARVTQTAVLAAAASATPARITQAALLVLGGLNVPTRITQAAILVLGRPGGGRVGTDAEAAAGFDACATSDAQCWKVTRTDGQVFAFTTHDEDIDFGGVTYRRCDSLRSSAFSGTTSSGTNTGDVQLTGILSDMSISAADLYAGRFDNAKVEVLLVDWKAGAGRLMSRGLICRTIQRENDYTLTALTGGARLEQQPLLEVYSPACRWELGDSRCKFNLPSIEVTGAVTSTPPANIINAQRRRVFSDTSRSEGPTVFKDGRITWTSGANIGLTFEVKDFTSGLATLWFPCPFNIQVGDTYTLRPGCDKTKTTCKTKFNNYDNFGGFPDLPGNDSINLTPNRTQ